MEQAQTNDLITTAEAARMLGLSVATLETKRVRPDRGDFSPPFYKLGKAVRYKRSEIEAIVEAARRTSTSDDGTDSQAA